MPLVNAGLKIVTFGQQCADSRCEVGNNSLKRLPDRYWLETRTRTDALGKQIIQNSCDLETAL